LTRSGDTVWAKIHELVGRPAKLSVVRSLIGLLAEQVAMYVVMGPAVSPAVGTVVSS
jgi:hypothetical protein